MLERLANGGSPGGSEGEHDESLYPEGGDDSMDGGDEEVRVIPRRALLRTNFIFATSAFSPAA
jgi:hypothetical protein